MVIAVLARKELRLLARDRRSLIILLAMPLILILILGLSLGEGFGEKPDNRLRVSVVNQDRGERTVGQFPGRPWFEVVRDDLAATAGIRVEVIESVELAQRLVQRGERSAVLVFGPGFSENVHRCSFLDDRFLPEPGLNPFYRDGVDLKVLGVTVLEDPQQPLAASIIRQVAQVSLLRVVMPWMIGRAFEKISDNQFIDEMSARVEVSSPFGKSKLRPLGILTSKQKAEVGSGVQASLQEMFKKYDLTAKTWAALTRSDPGQVEGGGISTYTEPPAGLLNRGALRYQILVPSNLVMFSFFLVLTVGWLFTTERRQGTMLRLRAAPISRAAILGGKLIPCYALSVGQGLLLLLAGRLIFGMSGGPEPLWLIPVVVCTSAAATGLAILIAALARTETQVAVYGTLLVLVLAGISGCLMPRDLMPDHVRQLSLITPHAWALDAYSQLLVNPNPDLTAVTLSCLVLVGFGVLFLLPAWWLFRTE
jgi:ABC-type multidrug transport system permease subunit